MHEDSGFVGSTRYPAMQANPQHLHTALIDGGYTVATAGKDFHLEQPDSWSPGFNGGFHDISQIFTPEIGWIVGNHGNGFPYETLASDATHFDQSVADFGLKFLENPPSSKWALNLGFLSGHTPWQPPQEFLDRSPSTR